VRGGPAAPGPRARRLAALLDGLERSQWWSAKRLRAYQLARARALLAHAREASAFHRRRLAECGVDLRTPLDAERWHRVPFLSREELEAAGAQARCRTLPAGHGRRVRRSTSGSTGNPLVIDATGLATLCWHAISMRDHVWHRRDLGGRLVAIRSGRHVGDPLAIRDYPSWGPPACWLSRTGPATLFYHRAPVPRQAAWILERDPDYLLAYPSNVLALCDHFRRAGERPGRIRQVRTYGEPLRPEVRDACREVLGAPVADLYSAEEIGYVALQCPEQHDAYHVQSESVLVEVLDDAGAPCPPGRTGRVVITALQNFATPLIRYDTGDFAQAGERCPCGRGLPVLGRVRGRARNRLTLPGGGHTWLDVPRAAWRRAAPVEDVQVVQHDREALLVRYVAVRALDAMESRAIAAAVRQAAGWPFLVSLERCEQIARRPNGKWEPVINQITIDGTSETGAGAGDERPGRR